MKALALARAAELKPKASELDAMRRTLEQLVDSCQGDDRPDCPIIVDLASGTDDEIDSAIVRSSEVPGEW